MKLVSLKTNPFIYIRAKEIKMKTQENIDYYILSLNQKKISLLKLHDTATEEIQDGFFPITMVEEYEYAKSSRGNSFGYALKGFEKDKSVIKKERFMHFLRSVNEKLKPYLTDDSALLLAGTDEDRNYFKKVSDYNNLISGEISGSFNSGNLSLLKQSISKILPKTH